MTLRGKTLLIIGLTLAGLAAVTYATSRAILMDGHLRLERTLVGRDLQRAASALTDDASQLRGIAQDWAWWDDTYQYMQDHNEAFVRSNIVVETFRSLRLDVLLCLNSSGRVVLGKGYDRRQSRWSPYPAELVEYLGRGVPPRGTTGLIRCAEGPMLFSAQPILTSDRQGPACGILVMGRWLESTETARLAQTTHLALSLYCLGDAAMPADCAAAIQGGVVGAGTAVRPLGENTVAGYRILKDVSGSPALLLRLESPRPIYRQGRAAVAYFLVALIASGLIVGTASLVLLERAVLSRLARLHASMARVVERNDLSVRVPDDGGDEVAGVARAANRMLATLHRRDAVLEAVSFAAERFLQTPSWEEGLDAVLERLGQAAGVNRVHIFRAQISTNGRHLVSRTNVWRAPGVVPASNADLFRSLDAVGQGYQRWLDTFLAGEAICGHVREMPEPERGLLNETGICSVALVPIFSGERWWGLMALDDGANEREWSHSEIDALRTAASILGAAIQRRQQEEERRRLETQVQHTQRLESLGVLAGGIAHDFNNLLMGVLANAELALMKLPEGSEVRPLVERVEAAGLRAAELTNQMLAYAGKGKFTNQSLDMADLVREMVGLLGSAISKKAVLRLDFATDLPRVQGDASQLRQVVMNLITNASEALGDATGVITISADTVVLSRAQIAEVHGGEGLPEGRYVAVTVSDTGAGMSPSTRARIFDPFFTTKFLGRGLGLAAVLGIVRGHGGGIRVESEPGRGSMFQIILPGVGSAAAQVTPETRQPNGWRGQGTILVVDDEEDVRDVARAILEQFGFAVLVAEDGRDGVEVFRERASEITAVLLDLNMPLMDGSEAFREIQRIRPGTRVILSSGYTEEDAGGRFAGTGVAGFIQKPYRPSALVEKIQQVLG